MGTNELWQLELKRQNLRLRSLILKEIRDFFYLNDYLEIETPIRIPAPLPEGHIDAIPSGDWFLQTSPEVSMKKLLAAGYEKIFQICKCFRSGERGRLHTPEFTMLEWYGAGRDYGWLMEECEEMLRWVAQRLGRGDSLSFRGKELSMRPPWQRLSVKEAFSRLAPISMEEALAEDRFDEILISAIEPHLGGGAPLFLYDYPLAQAAQARPKRDNPAMVERVELYMGGLEIANGFSELTDHEEYKRRFVKENELRQALGKTIYPPADRFLEAVKFLPPSAGMALGIDRLVMVFADASQIDEVLAFTPETL